MVYGKTKTYLPPVFKPHFVLYDKKCLSFKGYMTELINNETRVRFVIVTYFLEDDSLTVLEPPTIVSLRKYLTFSYLEHKFYRSFS